MTVTAAALTRVFRAEPGECPGKSDQNVINGIVEDFLHSPYRSVEEPLDVLFGSSGVHDGPGAIDPWSVGISIGSAKCMAALTIMHIVTANKFEEQELASIADELAALCVVRATTDPAGDVFGQIAKTISKKIRVSERSRPNPVQLEFAFQRVVLDLQSKGDKRKPATIMGAIIKQYNASQPAKGKLNPDERSAVLMLQEQENSFKEILKAHWRNYPVNLSAVPVSFLAFPWLSSAYEPAVKKAANPLHYQIQCPSTTKNVGWLKVGIGRYQQRLKELASTGKRVNLRGVAQQLRAGAEQDSFFHCVATFLHFEDAVRKCSGVQAFQELESKFLRGALERELMEKVKTKDPALVVEDFRFVQAAMEYDPTAAVPSAPKTQEAMATNLESSFKLDSLVLKGEQENWTEYLRAHKAFIADTHNAKVAHMEVRVLSRQGCELDANTIIMHRCVQLARTLMDLR